MRAHGIQLDIAWENKPTNHERVRSIIEHHGIAPGGLIVLPELFDVGFTLSIDAACDDDGRTLGYLKQLASDTGCTIHGSRAIRADEPGKAFNCACITFPDGREPVEYRKVHPFSYGREAESYNGGDSIGSYDWLAGDDLLAVCPAVCYDLRFPELFRQGFMQGAGAFVLGANWPSPRANHWRTLLIARAIENQGFVMGVNRCGNDPHLPYAGGSIAIGAKGEVLGELGGGEGVLSVDVDPDAIRAWRAEFPARMDIRLL